MTVKDLIDKLKMLPDDAVVICEFNVVKRIVFDVLENEVTINPCRE